MSSAFTETAAVFKAFCDENRLQILTMLRDREMCAYQLQEELVIGQSTLSHHMKVLCKSGIVTCRREGKWTYYRISEDGCEKAISLLREITTVAETNSGCGKCCE